MDENDNAPEFKIKTQRVRILRPKIGSKKNSVFRVYAVDKDEGNNSELSYKIQGKRSSPFYIEKTSGQIYVDEIEPGSYDFRVSIIVSLSNFDFVMKFYLNFTEYLMKLWMF